MAPNESDSSDDESQKFTATNVLLGFSSKEPTDDPFSQLGGYPIWLDPEIHPSAKLARCKVCHSMMTLMLQLNGDLPERFVGHERRLYIFACKLSPCRRKEGSIRAIRGVRISKAIGNSKPKSNVGSGREDEASQNGPRQNLGNTLFNSTSSATLTNANPNPFSTSAVTSNLNPFSISNPNPHHYLNAVYSNPFQPPSNPSNIVSTPNQPPSPSLAQTFAQKARLTSPPPHSEPAEPWPQPSNFPTPYPSHHLDADFETLDTSSPTPSTTSKITIDDDLPSSSKDEDEPDTFESPSLDKTFRRFADRLAQNPLQILRYEFAGSPLLYSKSDPVGKLLSPHLPSPSTPQPPPSNSKITTIPPTRSSSDSGIPPCPNCASGRVFELQLTPHAISDLEAEDEDGGGIMDGMDWGTVIVGVCARDCGPRGLEGGDVGYLEEWVGVQWEDFGGGGRR